MRAFFASPLGFLIGLSLGALGGGGSILAVPALVYGAGQDPKAATTTSLLLVGIASVVGMVAHWRSGRVRVGIGVVFGVCGIGGSLAGSALNEQIDPDALLLAFAGLIVVAAWRMASGVSTVTEDDTAALVAGESSESTRATTPTAAHFSLRSALTVLAAGTLVGFLTGLFGVGGGFVIVPALALALKLSMPEAIGTSLLVIVINSVVALSTRIATTSIDWAVTIPFAVATIIGVVSGSRLAGRLDPKRSIRWFAALLIGVAAYTAIQATVALTS